MAGGLVRGLDRESAARFSFLLGTPAILGAGVLQLFDVLRAQSPAPAWAAVIPGAIAAAVVGYLCIHYLLSYLRRGRLYVFAAYCAVLGLVIILASLLP